MSAGENIAASVVHRRVSAEDFHGTEYQRRVVDLRNGPYLDFPAVLSIETYTLCNAACDFCPYPGLERKGERMSDQLIEKILGDIEEIENRPPFEINLSRVNEPFLDTRILDLSVEIERRFPEATHMFFSNGTPLVEKTLLGLARLKKVGFLVVSLNDHRADHYERIMRLPFENTLRRLDLIEEMKAAGAFGFPIYVCRVGDGTAVDAEFLQFVKARYPSLSALVTVRGDWMGVVPSPAVGVVPDVGCRQWFQLHFLSNGKCAFCCIDSDGRHGIGDVRTAHAIRDIYNHPLKRAFRMEAPSRLSVEQCSGCSMLP